MSTPDLWLVQWLCPTRHALVAVAYDRLESTAPDAEARLLEAATRTGLRPVCGLCGSEVLHFEHGKLPYTDWESATAALFEAERRNIETRMTIDALKASSS